MKKTFLILLLMAVAITLSGCKKNDLTKIIDLVTITLHEDDTSFDGITNDMKITRNISRYPDVIVTWKSDNPLIEITDNSAIVTRPTDGLNVVVKLTATVHSKKESLSKVFSVIILCDDLKQKTVI